MATTSRLRHVTKVLNDTIFEYQHGRPVVTRLRAGYEQRPNEVLVGIMEDWVSAPDIASQIQPGKRWPAGFTREERERLLGLVALAQRIIVAMRVRATGAKVPVFKSRVSAVVVAPEETKPSLSERLQMRRRRRQKPVKEPSFLRFAWPSAEEEDITSTSLGPEELVLPEGSLAPVTEESATEEAAEPVEVPAEPGLVERLKGSVRAHPVLWGAGALGAGVAVWKLVIPAVRGN